MGTNASLFGERFGIDALTYNRYVFQQFDKLARSDAPYVVSALRSVYPDVASVVDVGAGSGAYAAEAQRRGLAALALERSPHGRRYAERAGVRVLPFDLTHTPPCAHRGGTFDLAYSFEVAEHVPEILSSALVQFLCSQAPIVVMTAAPPGQGGQGHINEQPADYWSRLFSTYGMAFSQHDHDALRAALPFASLSMHWSLTNLLTFRRKRVE